MQNPYGASPILAMIQVLFAGSSGVFTVKSGYGCTMKRTAPGVFVLQLNTGANVENTLVQVCQYNQAPEEVTPSYSGTTITISLGAGSPFVDPNDGTLLNAVVYNCTDDVTGQIFPVEAI